METYISNSNSDLKWSNYKIESFDFVYDLSLTPYGYVFELKNNKGNRGYGIAVYIDGKIKIVEASYETSSPFYDIKTDNNIFVSPLEYFSFENKTKNHSNNINVKDLSTGKNYDLNEYMCGGSSISCAPNDVQAMNAINKFGINHSSPKISTRNDGFWGDLTFNTIIDEINNNCPI